MANADTNGEPLKDSNESHASFSSALSGTEMGGTSPIHRPVGEVPATIGIRASEPGFQAKIDAAAQNLGDKGIAAIPLDQQIALAAKDTSIFHPPISEAGGKPLEPFATVPRLDTIPSTPIKPPVSLNRPRWDLGGSLQRAIAFVGKFIK
jgi:hypothetical protein